jgi:hypothetical protein
VVVRKRSQGHTRHIRADPPCPVIESGSWPSGEFRRVGAARTSGVIALLSYVVNHTGVRGKDCSVQTPNSSLSVRPVVALAWVMARSSALFFGCEKPCAVPL